jgi:cell division protein FtsB
MTSDLAQLKARRDALNAEIALMERGIERAAYDASMCNQLASVNKARAEKGEPPLSMAAFLASDGELP